MHSKQTRTALTLVELLVAVAVLSIVVALIVPRLRVINKERNIREVARVVGSAVSAARDSAVADSRAGVAIIRNTNFNAQTPDGNSVFYAGTQIVPLKAKTDYIGEGVGDASFAYWVDYDDGTGNGLRRAIQVLLTRPSNHDPDNLSLIHI